MNRSQTKPTVALLPGDLVGQLLAGPITELLAAAGAQIDWHWIEQVRSDDNAQQIDPQCIEKIREYKLALKGPFQAIESSDHLNPTVSLRRALDLYAGVRRFRNLPGVPSRYEDIDIIVVRENTEDVYVGLEHEVHPGVIESIKVVTRAASERIFRFAFQLAVEEGRKRVAIIHKANIMKQSDGLFLKVGLEIAQEFPQIEARSLIVDNTCMQMVQRPEQFDVMVCGNLYGDIISDLAAGLVGGYAPVWGEDRGDDVRIFEMLHNGAPRRTPAEQASPLPFLTPAIQLVRHIGQTEAADRLQAAVHTVLAARQSLTPSLGGTSTSLEMIAALKAAL